MYYGVFQMTLLYSVAVFWNGSYCWWWGLIENAGKANDGQMCRIWR